MPEGREIGIVLQRQSTTEEFHLQIGFGEIGNINLTPLFELLCRNTDGDIIQYLFD